MRDTRREYALVFEGGLDLESSSLTVQPGRMRACKNFEVDKLGGYTRIQGYERFDGQPAPSEGADSTEMTNRRNAIGKPPGVGPIRGVFPFKDKVYCFRDQSDDSAGFFESSASGWVEVTTPARTKGGRYQFAPYNFKATAETEVLIGVDGVNPAFMWDGTNFTEISIPGESEPPKFCRVMSNYLFLGIEKGLLYYSVVGTPTDFDSANGAGVIGTGGYLTGLEPSVGGALAVMMRDRISILQGSGPADWVEENLRNHDDKVGAVAYSALNYNQLYYLDDRGITNLAATEAFGSFASITMSTGVNPFLRVRQGLLVDGVVSRRKNQLRWIFDPAAGETGSEVLTATFNGNQMAGFSRQAYDHKITVIESSTLSTGEEIIVAGTEDGWVMRFDKGNSFDGAPIESYFRLPFVHFQTPQRRKKFLNALFNIQAQGTVTVSVKPLFNYNDPDKTAHVVSSMDTIGGGANWDEGNWNEFNWSAQINSEGYADIAGTGRNLSFVLYNNSADTPPYTFYDALIHYILRNWHR